MNHPAMQQFGTLWCRDRLLRIGVVSSLVLLTSLSVADAQFRGGARRNGRNPRAYTQASAQYAGISRTAYNPAAYRGAAGQYGAINNRYYRSGSFYPGSFQNGIRPIYPGSYYGIPAVSTSNTIVVNSSDPYGDYMSGNADLISGRNAKLEKQAEEQRAQQQQKQDAKEARRKAWEEWLYERPTPPTPEQIQERQQEIYERAKTSATPNQIWSGEALNALFDHVQKSFSFDHPAPEIPIDPAMLEQINLTSPNGGGMIGLLGNGGKLNWPDALHEGDFLPLTKQMDTLLPPAVEQAKQGSLPADGVARLRTVSDALQDELKRQAKDTPPNEFIQMRHYLNDLEDSIRNLGNPNIAQYLKGVWTAKGDDVGDLVMEMKKNNLRFAPGVSGTEPAYEALYHALLAFDAELTAAPQP